MANSSLYDHLIYLKLNGKWGVFNCLKNNWEIQPILDEIFTIHRENLFFCLYQGKYRVYNIKTQKFYPFIADILSRQDGKYHGMVFMFATDDSFYMRKGKYVFTLRVEGDNFKIYLQRKLNTRFEFE